MNSTDNKEPKTMEALPTRPTPVGPAFPRRAPESEPIEDEPHYVTVETAAAWIQRSPEMIRRFTRTTAKRPPILRSIPDPDDGRRILVADTDLIKLLRMKRRGWTTKTVQLESLTDGATISRTIATRKEG